MNSNRSNRTLGLLGASALALAACGPADSTGTQGLTPPTVGALGAPARGWHLTPNQPYDTEQAGLMALPDGRTLLAGGETGITVGSAATFDRASMTWSAAESMHWPRQSYASVTLRSSQVLVIGGARMVPLGDDRALSSVESFDPSTGMWSPIASLITVRSGHTATLLRDGRVLVVGGDDGTQFLASTEIFDPETSSWSAGPPLSAARCLHTATLLEDGRVLVAGGDATGVSAELYNPESGSWSPASPLNHTRQRAVAARLPSGRVMVASGSGPDGSSSEFYDPATNTWSEAPQMSAPHISGQGTALVDGTVLVLGGSTLNGEPTAAAEVFDERVGAWRRLPDFIFARTGTFSVGALPDGGALIVGPVAAGVPAEFFIP